MQVKCIMNQHGFNKFLTIGNIYDVVTSDQATYVVVSDDGTKMQFPKYLFEVLN